MLTIFTPTYNRAHLLPRLYQSLLLQDCFDFEWLVIDDGSTDGTGELFQDWIESTSEFRIRYFRVPNGGKQRAVNLGVELAEGEYFFIVDSDDALTTDSVSFTIKAFATIPSDTSYIGVSGLKGDMCGRPLSRPTMGDATWVDASNLERDRYGLKADMAEAFFTDKLKKYPFPVWESETFTPEAVVWDRMALDGYKLRWFNRVTYLCEYQPNGLTHSSWKLLKENPMGFALLFNVKLESEKSLRRRINLVSQYDSCCFLAGKIGLIMDCVFPHIAIALSPVGFFLSLRRKHQFIRRHA